MKKPNWNKQIEYILDNFDFTVLIDIGRHLGLLWAYTNFTDDAIRECRKTARILLKSVISGNIKYASTGLLKAEHNGCHLELSIHFNEIDSYSASNNINCRRH